MNANERISQHETQAAQRDRRAPIPVAIVFVLAALVPLAGCGPKYVVASARIPEPLVAKIPVSVALFVPPGFGLAFMGVRRRRALGLLLFATIAIELAQGVLLRGRFASLSDVVTNTTGGLAGYALADHWRAILGRARAKLPGLRRVSCYAMARNILAKSDDELAELRAAGLSRFYIGPESGDDVTLKKIP